MTRILKSLKDLSVISEGGGKLQTDDGHVSVPIDTSTPEKRDAMRKSVRKTMDAIQDHFVNNHQTNLFGSRLTTGEAYSGSSRHLMNKNISSNEFAKHKPAVGDIDVSIPHHTRDIVSQGLRHNQTFGDHTILKVHRKAEVHVLARHNPTGHIHQIDFEPTKDTDDPFSSFSRSSSWKDTKTHPEFKGAHHKILLNVAGGEKYKFGTKGLVSRNDETDSTKDLKGITRKLFGNKADHKHIDSFTGVTHLIKNHLSSEHHSNIIDRFSKNVGEDHPATKYLKQKLGPKSLKEAYDESHVSGFFGGVDPHTHAGHVEDMKKLHQQTGAKKIVFGMSQKGTSVFSDSEKKNIVKKQWGEGIHPIVTRSMGSMAAEAHKQAGDAPKKVLHLLVGADREAMGKNFIKSLNSGKIPEMEGKSFHKIHLHVASGDRTHGMSGTKMRTAAENNDIETYKKHLGSNFSDNEAKKHFTRIRAGILSGKLKVKRK